MIIFPALIFGLGLMVTFLVGVAVGVYLGQRLPA